MATTNKHRSIHGGAVLPAHNNRIAVARGKAVENRKNTSPRRLPSAIKPSTKFRRSSSWVSGDEKAKNTNDSFATSSKNCHEGYFDDIDDIGQSDSRNDVSNKQVIEHIVDATNLKIIDDAKSSKFDDIDLLEDDDYKPLYTFELKAPSVSVRADGGDAELRKKRSQQSYQIEVLPVKIDRLAATNQIPSNLKPIVVLKAIALTNSNSSRGAWLKKEFIKGGTRYQYSYGVYVEDTNGLPVRLGMIQLQPGNEDHAFLRFELNPAVVGQDGCLAFKDMLKRILGKTARKILSGAKITLLDIAVDVHGIPINALLLFSNKGGDSLVWGRHFDGKRLDRLHIQTVQIGSKKSCKSSTIYDKRAERDGKGKMHGNNQECVRVEGRLRPTVMVEGKRRHGLYLNELSHLPNPFVGINIAIYLPTGNKDWVFDLFLDATQQIGAQAALAKVSRAKRSTYRAHLKAGAVDWWHPDKVITDVPATLKASGLFPPEAFG